MDLQTALTETFDDFVEKLLLKKDLSRQYQGITKVIMTFMIHGLPDFYQVSEQEKEVLTLDCFWSLIFPCLTEKGREEYETLGRSPSFGSF